MTRFDKVDRMEDFVALSADLSRLVNCGANLNDIYNCVFDRGGLRDCMLSTGCLPQRSYYHETKQELLQLFADACEESAASYRKILSALRPPNE